MNQADADFSTDASSVSATSLRERTGTQFKEAFSKRKTEESQHTRRYKEDVRGCVTVRRHIAFSFNNSLFPLCRRALL